MANDNEFSYDESVKLIDSGMQSADFFGTFARIWQAKAYIDHNRTNDESALDDEDTTFDDYCFNHNWYIGLLAGTGAFFLAGILGKVYESYRKKQLISYEYLIEQLKKQGIEKSVEEIQDKITKHLLEMSSPYALDKNNKTHLVFEAPERKKLDNPPKKVNQDLINELRTSPLGKFCKQAWDFAGQQTFIFWIAFMVVDLTFGRRLLRQDSSGFAKNLLIPVILAISVGAMILLGLGKAIADTIKLIKTPKEKRTDETPTLGKIISQFIATVIAPIVLTITVVAMVVYTIGKSLGRFGSFLKSKFNPDPNLEKQKLLKPKQQIEPADSKQLLLIRLKQRVFAEFEHEAQPSIIKSPSKQAAKNVGQADDQAINEEDSNPMPSPGVASRGIREYLLDSKAKSVAKIALNAFMDGKNGFLQVAFVTWFACVGLGWLATAVPSLGFLSIAVGFLGGPFVLLIGGAAFGLILFAKSIAKTRAEQKAHEAKVEATLMQEYRYSPGKTKEAKFDELHAQIEAKKANITKLRAEIDGLCEGNPLHKREDLKVSKYDLKKVADSYNHDYFEKQRHFVPKFTYFKKGLKRVKEFLGGGQTGVLIVRLSLLTGGIAAVAAGLVIAPWVVFFAAGVAAAAFGTFRLLQYINERKQQQKEHLVNTLDDRIAYQEQKLEELTNLENELKVNVEKLSDAQDKQFVGLDTTSSVLDSLVPKHLASEKVKRNSNSSGSEDTDSPRSSSFDSVGSTDGAPPYRGGMFVPLIIPPVNENEALFSAENSSASPRAIAVGAN